MATISLKVSYALSNTTTHFFYLCNAFTYLKVLATSKPDNRCQ